MAKFYTLYSSSKGNASFLGSVSGGILIDAGVSCRKLCQALQERNLAPDAVQGILITHSHSDHIAGLRVFLKQHPVPVCATRETLEEIQRETCLPEHADLREIPADGTFSLGGLEVTAYPTSHDASGSCGYRVTMPDGQCCAVCTDLGCVTPEVEQTVCGADLVLLEANYDPELLRSGPYPPCLQQRIRGKYGHLSNSDSARLAETLIASGTTRLILGHLSETNNTMSLAQQTVLSHLRQQGMEPGRDFLLETASPEGLEQAVIF